MKIKVLDPLVANQIAAGEVIERPASIVKECLENALDAGAADLKIQVEKGGMQSIRITDNGHGIAKEDLPNAVQRHGTSKIEKLEDLSAIASLGFRGEALASICAVAKVEIISATAEQSHGWQLKAAGIQTQLQPEPQAHPKGTTFIARDLFFNIPARRRFLRTEKTEFLKIDEVVRHIALSRFNVSLSFSHNQKKIYQLPKVTSKALETRRLKQILGQEFVDHALKIDMEATGLKLWGWICDKNFSRASTDMQYMYINGRMVRDKLLNHAIKQVYSKILNDNQFAAYVLFLELNPETVDVNVHPTKHEVRFHESRLIHDFVVNVLTKALGETQQQSQLVNNVVEHVAENYRREPLPATAQVAETSTIYGKLQAPTDTPSDTLMHHFGEPMANMSNLYLITQTSDVLGIVNIKKVRAIAFHKALKQAIIKTKPLLFPLTLKLNEPGARNLLGAQENLKVLGFNLDALGHNQFIVRAVPEFLECVNLEDCLYELSTKEVLDVNKSLVEAAVTNLRPFENTLAQNKLLKWMANHLSDKEKALCFRKLTVSELNGFFS